MWLREIVTKMLINPIIRTRTCHFRHMYHPHMTFWTTAGNGQSLLGFTTCLDPSLRLLVAPCDQIPVPTPLPQSSDQHHCGFFLGDFLMLRYGLHHSRIGLNLLCIRLRHFVGGGCLLTGFLETLCPMVNARHNIFTSLLDRLIPLWPYGLY
jgi:hypothetical protein